MRRFGEILLAIVLLGMLADASAGTGSSASAFDAANQLFEQGKFTDAATAFDRLAQSGQVSEPLYFNLGNAWFKANRLGRAILAYRQAEQLAPRDPDLRANLQFARNQVQGPTLAIRPWHRWIGRLTLNEWTLLAAAAVWVWFLLLAICQWQKALRPLLRSYLFALGFLALLLCAGLAAAFGQNRMARTVIVVASEAVVRQSPFGESQAMFTVHDGAELEVLDQKDQWLQVSTDPRRIGWIPRDQVTVATGVSTQEHF
jgi:tetratricopeptide (TPR) repeat protein